MSHYDQQTEPAQGQWGNPARTGDGDRWKFVITAPDGTERTTFTDAVAARQNPIPVSFVLSRVHQIVAELVELDLKQQRR